MRGEFGSGWTCPGARNPETDARVDGSMERTIVEGGGPPSRSAEEPDAQLVASWEHIGGVQPDPIYGVCQAGMSSLA